jgi:tetratricopeptide (TPR) repeat protein
MPSIQQGSFLMTDHWIRVHPEQAIKAAAHDDKLKSRVEPKREFLRIIVVEDRAKAEAASQRLASGPSFTDVAHSMSTDPTAPGGGFIGEMQLSQMDPKLSAAASELQYGATSPIVELGDRWIILHRMSRDFKWEANQLFLKASALKTSGDLKGAIDKDQQALQIYPYFLRALVFMGTSLGETGNAQRASEILGFAVQFYPKDASAQFDLGLTLQHQPAEQIEAFRRAIELDPDLTSAYQSLGAALYSAGQSQSAIDVFRKGLQVDPLSALLNYDLGLALMQQGDKEGGQRALTLAKKIDPEVAPKTRK